MSCSSCLFPLLSKKSAERTVRASPLRDSWLDCSLRPWPVRGGGNTPLVQPSAQTRLAELRPSSPVVAHLRPLARTASKEGLARVRHDAPKREEDLSGKAPPPRTSRACEGQAYPSKSVTTVWYARATKRAKTPSRSHRGWPRGLRAAPRRSADVWDAYVLVCGSFRRSQRRQGGEGVFRGSAVGTTARTFFLFSGSGLFLLSSLTQVDTMDASFPRPARFRQAGARPAPPPPTSTSRPPHSSRPGAWIPAWGS